MHAEKPTTEGSARGPVRALVERTNTIVSLYMRAGGDAERMAHVEDWRRICAEADGMDAWEPVAVKDTLVEPDGKLLFRTVERWDMRYEYAVMRRRKDAPNA